MGLEGLLVGLHKLLVDSYNFSSPSMPISCASLDEAPLEALCEEFSIFSVTPYFSRMGVNRFIPEEQNFEIFQISQIIAPIEEG